LLSEAEKRQSDAIAVLDDLDRPLRGRRGRRDAGARRRRSRGA
jgi:hypothetical protein